MINKDYIYTQIYENAINFYCQPNSIFIYSPLLEERNEIEKYPQIFNNKNIETLNIQYDKDNNTLIDPTTKDIFTLRSEVKILNFLHKYSQKSCLYFNISGLDTKLCAVFLKSIFKNYNNLPQIYFIYTEPKFYDIKKFKESGIYFDMSEEINGISPIPGFEYILPDDDPENTIFLIPFLGFEGGRFAHIIEHITILDQNIIPVVGLTGFRLEYPFISLKGNQRPLTQTNSWEHIKYAQANSIVDALDCMINIYNNNPNCLYKIALIGTKPHAIASIIFALLHQKNVELIYDNPIRKKRRTEGLGKIIVTDITKLLNNYAHKS